MSRPVFHIVAVAAVSLPLATGCRQAQDAPLPKAQPTTSASGTVQVAFITNNPSDFWRIAHAGIRKAEAELDVSCEFLTPTQGTADQQRMVETLIAKGVSGMAISPNDAENQVDLINQACAVMNVITHDSDAPKSNRLCYVGTNNYKAGREAGKLVKEVLPRGGKIMLFVGRMDAQNAIERRAGIIDELKGLPESTAPADAGAPSNSGLIQAGNIVVVDTRTDGTDRVRAKQNVEDTITSHADIGCLVGLWSYNGPSILSALKDAGKLGQIKVVCFDEEEDTLQGVTDGHIHATVVQQPYEFGYQSVKILTALARGDKSLLPANGVVDVPVQIVRPDNVAEFWATLKKLTAEPDRTENKDP